jgi:uncharacterized protein YdaU (DUF1376 family)
MNYYERHLGDYAKDTAHLTMLEHGAYSLLLDRYYGTEKGIPEDQTHRVARARSKEEKQAVDAVLEEFFILQDGVWINRRAEEEITRAQTKIKAAQENGKKGGRPKSNRSQTQEEPTGFNLGYENETQQKAHQTPDTNHQLPLSSNNTHTTLEVIGEPSMQGRVCVELQKMGIMYVNPHSAELLELIEKGVSMKDFIAAGTDAVNKEKLLFNYVIGILKNRINEKSQSDPSRSHSGSTKNNSRGNYDRTQHEEQSGFSEGFAKKYGHFIEA